MAGIICRRLSAETSRPAGSATGDRNRRWSAWATGPERTLFGRRNAHRSRPARLFEIPSDYTVDHTSEPRMSFTLPESFRAERAR